MHRRYDNKQCRTPIPTSLQLRRPFRLASIGWPRQIALAGLLALPWRRTMTIHLINDCGYNHITIRDVIRWLTAQGNFKFVDDKMVFDGTRNNPILKWKDGKCITRKVTNPLIQWWLTLTQPKEAEDELGFKTKVLWTDSKYFHASQVEVGIQKHFTHHEKIGYPRMHRVIVLIWKSIM